ncbi:MAG: fibrobacter succinogenes major paralogous domain-containing protein [Rikenellaceae bacterium]|nr:fibrobacter succinogenes major paralogous domain-containing protein [Rikenellaceae bacterium]
MEFPAVGYRRDLSGSLQYAGREGHYWSSSVAYDSNYAYRLYFNSGSLPVNYDNKQYGFSVRCVR